MLSVIVMYISFALLFPIGRVISGAIGPLFFTGSRMIVGGLFLLIYHKMRYGSWTQAQTRQHWGLISLFALFGIFLTNAPEFWALQYVPAFKAAFVYSLSPFLAAIIAYFILGERMSMTKIIGMLVGFSGFLLILMYDAPNEEHIGGIWFISSGEIALLLAACSTVVGWITVKTLVHRKSVHPTQIIGWGAFGGGILCMLSSLATEVWNPLPINDMHTFIVALIICVVGPTMFSYTMYTILLRRYSATFMSFAGFIQPPAAAIMSWFWLGETITWRFIVASSIVFLGLCIFYKEEIKESQILSD